MRSEFDCGSCREFEIILLATTAVVFLSLFGGANKGLCFNHISFDCGEAAENSRSGIRFIICLFFKTSVAINVNTRDQ
jgi:hypothetical protein